jgi:cell division protein FtsW
MQTPSKSHTSNPQNRHSTDRDFDRSLFLAILFLCGLGLVQVYSSSFIFAIESFDDGLFFVKKQALFVFAAILVLIATAYMPWAWLKKMSYVIWFAAFVGVCLTLVPGLGVKVGGATRWLNLGGGYRIEPSEILKYTYPFVWAYFLNKISAARERLLVKDYLFLVVSLVPMVILLKQPDFGSVAMIAFVAFALLFACGLRWRYVFASLTVLVTAGYFLIMREEYRRARITAFLDPWADPAQKGFQVIQSMLGFYSGGVTGVGMGQGQGKLFFLPEAHTDFTLSVLGEELGFVGILITLSIFGFVIMRGFQISARANDLYKMVIALGVTLMFAVTSLVNASVALGLLPTKGLGMPFLSYGGSALLAICFGLGILLNIDRNQNLKTVK